MENIHLHGGGLFSELNSLVFNLFLRSLIEEIAVDFFSTHRFFNLSVSREQRFLWQRTPIHINEKAISEQVTEQGLSSGSEMKSHFAVCGDIFCIC